MMLEELGDPSQEPLSIWTSTLFCLGLRLGVQPRPFLFSATFQRSVGFEMANIKTPTVQGPIQISGSDAELAKTETPHLVCCTSQLSILVAAETRISVVSLAL